jgi:(1->4)-alpha-D-glucan 1-alpha-D-glucosylmutase
MAKGLEDTACYVYNALISRNDVGSDPVRKREPRDINGFHVFCEERAKNWPYSLNATSTHDTKRSEDVRARINVLTELSTDWQKRLLQWHRTNQQHRSEADGILVPTPSEEVLYYQTLLGAWPLDPAEIEGFKARIKNFAIKAAREGKTYSDWIRPNEPHESACLSFLDKVLEQNPGNRFMKSFLRFQRLVAWHGMLNSLSQVVLKTMAPGIPDIYQGTELWDFSLVDPDNRHPVDFAVRNAILEAHSHSASLSKWKDGAVKLFVTEKALDLRNRRRVLFLTGEYLPLRVSGPKRDNVLAFARHAGSDWCLVIVPRWTTQLAPAGKLPVGSEVWGECSISLPEGAPRQWKNVLTGETCESLLVADLLNSFPVAILES